MPDNDRLERISRALQADGLDAVLVSSPAGTCYLSGCYLLTQTVIPEREAYVLITAEGRASYLVCNIEAASARHSSRIEAIHTYVEFAELPARAAAAMIQAAGLGRARIGLEAHALARHSWQALQEALPGAQLAPWDARLQQQFMLKSDFEIDALEQAGRATQQAIEAGLSGAEPGSRELDVANRVLQGIMAAGIMPLFNVFAAGPKMLQAHAEAGLRLLQPGEIVRLDMGGRSSESNYLSDMARTAVVGRPDAGQSAAYAALYEIQTAVIEAARPGTPAGELFSICQAGFERHGLPFGMPHIGHGMGIGLHEAPMLHPGNQTLLQPGMVLNIEPFLALPERNESYHVEDLLVVTEAAPRLLTSPQPELIRIPA